MNSRASFLMRVVALTVALLLLLGLAASELTWRLDHPPAQAAIHSPNGSQVADVRFMPEGSVIPYGAGIFLRSKWAVMHSLQAEFAFGAYCGNLAAQWSSDQRLAVHCDLLEGVPLVPSPVVKGIAIEVNIHRKRAKNSSLPLAHHHWPRPHPHVDELGTY